MSTKWKNTWKHACFCAYTLKIYMKAFSPFRAHLYPPPPPPRYIITDKGLLSMLPCAIVMHLLSDFWQYTSSYREQPQANFLNWVIVQFGDTSPTGVKTWSSFPNLNILLQPEELAIPIVRVGAAILCEYSSSEPMSS